MLAVSNLSKSYGLKSVLKNVSFTINERQRAALVGPNGCGKTTLCRLLTGTEKADSGSFAFTPAGIQIGYLPQGLVYPPGQTVSEFLDSHHQTTDRLEARLTDLAEKIASSPNDQHVQQTYDHVLQQLSFLAQEPDRSEEILASLELDHFTPVTPVDHLSGGQKTRLALAGILLTRPRFLILDEPTNHLDIDMLVWLETYLKESALTMLCISHDRTFLDAVATQILELDPVSHAITEYAGNFSGYLDAKASERDRQWQEYHDQQEEIKRLSAAAAHIRGIATFRKGGKADGGDKFAKGFFANRGLETVRRAKTIEKRITRLLDEDRIDKPRQTWQMKIEFSGLTEGARDVLILQDLTVGYGGNALASNIDLTLKHRQRTILIGPNGSGKTTLLRTIAGLIPPIAGSYRLGSNIHLGYMAQEQETLSPQDTALTAVQRVLSGSETEIRSYLSKYLFKGDDVFTRVASMSHGERARLSLACLVASGCNFLILDEPINHLDIPARVRFETALAEFDGTVLAVVHDRYFIQSFATTIWELRNGKVQIIA